MKSDRRALLDKILEYQFVCIELNLYLDNNPNDERALCQYDIYSNKLKHAKCEYEKEYGPLTNFGSVPSSYPWEWVDNPWPWDNEFYK
ncbi:spore coat peptide assembly protein [[Clostridium] sordellii]|uniref:spore coat protein CotJB n=1 Tax=Paraclostridium sordellii TaxID=1505 RepID=UPI0005E80035|nr:spore coat protein CotJB [Paeniclostridium sordellii]MBX9179911.1 spore coat protein CotJB [Paeniclostridium sordellii]CEO11506.1 spore coat peptide assembly protein [[Clostridium] sordellii] [Paeniclostridium sordellii]